MELSLFFMMVLLPFIASGLGFRSSEASTPSTIEKVRQTRSTKVFDATALLDSRRRKPEIYTKAMVELKRLEEEPLCHRTATQLLMNNCQGLEDINQVEYQLHSSRIQRHHVESLAATLAICDMECRFVIPDACTPFRLRALLEASDGKGTLDVSTQQVASCLEALGQNHSHWNTWLSYRDTALLLCQASRLDIEKDQSILLHKKLMEIMAEFSEGLANDLKDLKQSMADQAQEANSYFDGIKVHADTIKSMMQGTLESFSIDIKDARNVLQAAKDSAADIQRVMTMIIDNALQNHAHMAAEHEQALVLATNNVESRMHGINDAAGVSAELLTGLKSTIETLLPAMVSVGEYQADFEQKFDEMSTTMNNMTTILQDHTESIKQASSTILSMNEMLGGAAAAAESMAASFGQSGCLIEYTVQFGSPVLTLLLGNYGLNPTLTRNVALLAGGFVIGQVIGHWHWASDLLWTRQATGPSTPSQLARERVGTPLNTDTTIIISSPTPFPATETAPLASKFEMV